MRRTAPLILIAALLLTSCSTPTVAPAEQPTPTPTATAADERTQVDWSVLPPEYQRIIDEDTAAKNCAGLQETFDAARDDVALLTYIDEALEIAGCY